MAVRQFEPDPEEEQRLLDEAMADVTPLPRDERTLVHRPPPVPQASQPYKPPPARRRDDEPDETEGDAGYVAHGVDRRELRKLRRGQYVPARRLDLHGLTSREALHEVRAFIDQHRGAYRCVAIVHGRGNHSPGRAILKRDTRAFLRDHHAVLAYTDAPRDDGGSGAVYVLLRGR
ncbi:MAG: Smr/MutS family protein [Vicinamibacterales bacterium]